ncbi:hypothetical protein N9I08_00340 [Candidatus Pelagibacter sp.]|jgi:ribulose-phosphate 3-epimerase|nr:hypothetical protein [Candidatus Pelagibacter sp.]
MNILKIITNKIKNIKKIDKPTIIGIDGPTAAGKTFLSKNLKALLRKNFKTIWICQLDWTLKSRAYRSNSLKLFKAQNTNFYYESQDHMDLDQIKKCLNKISEFDYKKNKSIKVNLKGLYNRATATNDFSISEKINKDSLIIVEGHYTSIIELDNVIDFNILLLAEKKELLKRKINRVKHYRNSEDTKQYFNLIDVPSFINHLSLFGCNYDLILDNTDYNKPKIQDKNCIHLWMDKLTAKENSSIDTFEDFIKRNFYSNLVNQLNFKSSFNIILDEFINFDKFVSNNIKINIQEINIDLSSFLNKILLSINKKIKSDNLFLDLKFTNNFHKIYYKKSPFFVGLKLNKINNKLAEDINLIIKITNKEFAIDIFWHGGVETIYSKRDLGKVYNNYLFKFEKKNLKQNFSNNRKKPNNLKVFIPTNFMYLDFIGEYYNVDHIFTNREETTISAVDILEIFLKEEAFWIHRFSKFGERDYFHKVILSLGAKCWSIGNYIICYKLYNRDLNKKLDDLLKNWTLKDNKLELFSKSKADYDKKIDKDRLDLVKFVNSKTKLFKAFDNSIFLAKGSFFNVSQAILKKDLKTLLLCKNRNVRKGITLLIEKNFANLSLDLQSLWKDKVDTDKKNISLSSFTNISPTILSDMYLWLSIKKDDSSILACNVYDIRENSFDKRAYLEAAQSINCPVVIQSSFNALGPKTRNGKSTIEGYLKLKNGGKEFLINTYKTARDVYIKNEKNFLFGIGLDHVDVRNDTPKGRAKNFLKELQKYNLVTHYTLDGSYILERNTKKNFSLEKNKLFNQVIDYEIDLIKAISNYNIFDYEFCASELSYVGNNRRVFIPSIKDMIFFSKSLSQKLNANSLGLVNMRPKLIIGNLGTTHHGHDQNVKVENSEQWVENIKKFGMVSAVLHGTSRSHPETLKRAIIGCKKINVAGDFLQCLVSNLPEKFRSIVASDNDNEKKKLYLIREKLKNISFKKKEKIKDSLKYKCLDIMRNINSPTMTDLDINYFKYKLYNYDNLQVKSITNSIISEINNFKKIDINKKKIHSVFLPSPIEVEYGNLFKKIIKSSIELGLKRFHIDVGDGKFINRVLNVENKVSYIKELNQSNNVHVHLMTINPHYGKDKSYISRYANLGADRIGIHRKSITNKNEISEALVMIKSYGKEAGIFLEVDEMVDENLLNTIIKHNINWVVLMGVPVGFGGQFFNEQVLFKAITLRKFALKEKRNLKIEVDGGLDRDNIIMCKKFGVDYLAGWSLVKSSNINEYKKNINIIKNKLKDA